MSPLVTYEIVDHVATITYNHPDALNAINGGDASGAQWGLQPLPGRRGGVGGHCHWHREGLLRRW